MPTMTYIPNFTAPNVVKAGANSAKHIALKKHNFSYSVDVYFKCSTKITYLSKDLLLSTLVGLSLKVGVSITKKQ